MNLTVLVTRRKPQQTGKKYERDRSDRLGCTHAGNHQPELTARDYRQQHDADEKDTGEVVNLQGIGAEVGGISPFSDRETRCGQPGTAGEWLAGGVLGGDDLLIRDAKADTEVYEAQPADNTIRPRDVGDQARLPGGTPLWGLSDNCR